jgi:hypothetical protein
MSPDRAGTVHISITHIKLNETEIAGNLCLHEYSVLFMRVNMIRLGRVGFEPSVRIPCFGSMFRYYRGTNIFLLAMSCPLVMLFLARTGVSVLSVY